MATAPVIEAIGLTKEYHGIAAVKAVTWSVQPGEVHSLLGENGAGKSTLMKMFAGVTAPTSGTLRVSGKTAVFSSPRAASDAGIAMVFQETNLVPAMTVAQNLFLGAEKTVNFLQPLYLRSQELLQSLNFDVSPWSVVSTLSSAKRQMVEIARAVRKDAKVIIFDEPTATLSPVEKTLFFALVNRLRVRGVTVIFITHALEEALSISDRITILRDGEIVTSGVVTDFNRESIIRAMVGRELGIAMYQKRLGARPTNQKILSVKNVSMGRMVRNTSFSIYAGQITGIFGLIGSGRSETAKVIAGALKRNAFHGGEIVFMGRDVLHRTPRTGVKSGIIYVTEDRKVEGFFDHMSIGENLHMSLMAADLEQSGRVDRNEMLELAARWSKKLNIRTLDSSSKVIELSGGNQQKVVIAAALAKQPKLLILDEPTRGVDVGAISDIHKLIHGLADAGMAVVVISSYLPEILSLSDRILVSRSGRIVEEFAATDVTEEEIMFAAAH
jgi:simple sugar transport system ATP-binding protein